MNEVLISKLDPARPIHLAGIAGSAMNGLATIFRSLGFQVVGTDPNGASVRSRLTSLGIEVFDEQDGSRIPPDASLVVASAALEADHPEIRAAGALGIPVISYAECIGRLMSERRGVAVAGTHGKTTVTSMIVSVLHRQGIEPGFVVGGHIPELGGGAQAGSSDIFVAEACEYNRSFLNFFPEVGVITNIEADHLDIYGTFAQVKQAFADFASNLREKNGCLVYSEDCPHTSAVISGMGLETVSYSINKETTLRAVDCRPSAEGTAFELVIEGRSHGEVSLTVPGPHNVANALAAIGVCRILGVDESRAAEALGSFTGASRRFEHRGEVGGITFIDDYAHHPTELKFLLTSARQRFEGRRIILAFQPHQYSRTAALLDDFSAAIRAADEVLIPNIYFARDSSADVEAFDPDRFEFEMRRHGASVAYIGSLEALVDRLVAMLRSGDVLITAGAGDIDSIIEPLKAELSTAG